jgi:hypothetical protein
VGRELTDSLDEVYPHNAREGPIRQSVCDVAPIEGKPTSNIVKHAFPWLEDAVAPPTTHILKRVCPFSLWAVQNTLRFLGRRGGLLIVRRHDSIVPAGRSHDAQMNRAGCLSVGEREQQERETERIGKWNDWNKTLVSDT